MNEKDRTQVIALQKPANDDKEAWKAHWKQQGWQWRIEPEIDAERQRFLTERRSVTADIEQSIYLFKDIKLSRADVEWLLATHENGRGQWIGAMRANGNAKGWTYAALIYVRSTWVACR